MNKTAQLVLSFVEFEQRYPEATLEDFARHLLARSRKAGPLVPGMKGHSVLAKVIGRLMRLNSYYANAALEPTGIGGLDEFTYLLTIDMMKAPMKTEVINQNFHELSSGLLIMSRLKKNGLITERPDTQDKRSKRITLTKKGRTVLAAAQRALLRVSELFFDSLGEDDIQLAVSMLSPIEHRFAARWVLDKGRPFEEMAGKKKGGS